MEDSHKRKASRKALMRWGGVAIALFALTSYTILTPGEFANNNQPEFTEYGIRLLERDSLIRDVNLLEQALTEMHPGLYRYNSQKDIQQLFTNFKNDLPDQMEESDFMAEMAKVIHEIKCGHTYLNPWNLNPTVRERLFGGETYFPIGFEVVDGRFFTTENATDDQRVKRGAEILAINNQPIGEIYNRLSGISKYDGNNASPIDDYLSLYNYDAKTWQAFDIYFQLFFPLQGQENYKLSFRNFGDKEIQRIEVPAMGKLERADKMLAKYGDDILEKESWSLDVLSEDLAVMRLGTFAIWKWQDFDQEKWFADAFHQLDSLNIPRLAIDIRGNGGGLSDPADELLSYLIEDTMKQASTGKIYIRTTKFNPDLMPHIDTWVEVLKEGLPSEMYQDGRDGLYELFEPAVYKDIAPKENRFKGEVFVFGDASNVSATFTLLKKSNDFGIATFIGEESGGNQQGINGGQYAFFTMPYSQIEVDIPLKFFSPTSERPDAGIKPAVAITTSQEDIALKKDPYLEYVQGIK
ncbi:MAG: hypothetical protein HRT74_09215 [Flavobacteriales bacterium]|nr:hypothetical protein [Flavobacteriales bacterium]